MINKVLIILVLCSILAKGYNIYLVSPQSYGHAYPVITLANALSNVGHNVTYFSFSMACENLTLTVGPGVHHVKFGSTRTPEDCAFILYYIKNPSRSPIIAIQRLSKMFSYLTVSIPEELEKHSKPDLIIYDFFAFSAGSFATKYSIPGASISPTILERNWASFEPCMTSSPIIETYVDRVINTVKCSVEGVLFNSLFGFCNYLLYTNDYPPPDMDSHLKLINTQFGFEAPQYISPLTKLIGPLLSLDRQEKDEEVQKVLDSAMSSGKNVMYVSLGTVWSLNEANMWEFIDALSQLKDLVIIWPIKDQQKSIPMDKLPEHIHLFYHVPQLQVLSHPQVKLFLSHCGANSMIEAIWFGVPILPIPIAADQRPNAHKLISLNLTSVVLDSKNLKSETIVSAVNKYLKDETYRNKTKELSNYIRSRDNINQAVKEVETFINMGESRQLLMKKKPNFFVYYQIDILLTLIAALVVAYYLMKMCWKITKMICGRCCNRCVKKKKTE